MLIQIAIAFFGHNLVHVFERYAFPILAIIFVIAVCWIFAKSSPGAPSHGGGIGGFLITLGAAFGYAVGWNPYAADYTRYFAPDTSKKAIALWSGLGVFVSCVLLEAAGAASATVTGIGAINTNPTGAFTGHLPTALADLTLLAIALGAIAANVLNIYSGALSFTAMGIKLPLALRRAIVAGVFGVIGFIVALTGLHDAGTKYKNFLLVIAYWIAPVAGRGVLRPVPAPPPAPAGAGTPAVRHQVLRTGPGRWPCWSAWWCRSSCSRTRPSTSASCPSTSRRSAT